MKNNNSLNMVVAVVLLTLIVVRFFITEENLFWLSGINFSGVVVAFFSLYRQVAEECKNSKKVTYFIGLCMLALFVLVPVAVCIFVGIIEVSDLANDVITLSALLISLPMPLYKKFLIERLK